MFIVFTEQRKGIINWLKKNDEFIKDQEFFYWGSLVLPISNTLLSIHLSWPVFVAGPQAIRRAIPLVFFFFEKKKNFSFRKHMYLANHKPFKSWCLTRSDRTGWWWCCRSIWCIKNERSLAVSDIIARQQLFGWLHLNDYVSNRRCGSPVTVEKNRSICMRKQSRWCLSRRYLYYFSEQIKMKNNFVFTLYFWWTKLMNCLIPSLLQTFELFRRS